MAEPHTPCRADTRAALQILYRGRPDYGRDRGRPYRRGQPEQRAGEPPRALQALPLGPDGPRSGVRPSATRTDRGGGCESLGRRDLDRRPGRFFAPSSLETEFYDAGTSAQTEQPEGDRRDDSRRSRDASRRGAPAPRGDAARAGLAPERSRRPGVGPARADARRKQAARGGGPLRPRASLRAAREDRPALDRRRDADRPPAGPVQRSCVRVRPIAGVAIEGETDWR